MSLSATSLTLHNDASVTTDLWVNYQAGAPYHNTHPSDGDAVGIMDDAGHAYAWAGLFPTFESSAPLLGLSEIVFDGIRAVYELDSEDGLSVIAPSSVLGASGKTLHFIIYPEAIATNFTGAANAVKNDCLIEAAAGYFGVYLRDNGSVTADLNGVSSRYKVIAYNYGGADVSIELSITLNTASLITVRHDGSLLYIAVNGGTPISTASGSTVSLAAPLKFGKSAFVAFFTGRLGELALYNACLTGATLTANESFLTTKWSIAVGGGTPLLINVAD